MTSEEAIYNDSSQRQHHEIMEHQERQAFNVAKVEFNLFQMLSAKLYLDGNQWCVLYGNNLQEGICGFGVSPYQAILDFNKAWYEPIKENA